MVDKVFDVVLHVGEQNKRHPQMGIWEQIITDLTAKFQANLRYQKKSARFRIVMEVEVGE